MRKRLSASSPLLDTATRLTLVGIVGGSGSGKSWLARKLQAALSPYAVRLSLDDFYRDRSHLSPARRARLNFDHPRTIDWRCLEKSLGQLLAGRATRIPDYDFATHSRRQRPKIIRPKPLILIDGLWLLHRPALRRLFGLTIYLGCPARLRLRRRLARDRLTRGRTGASVREQFRRTVEPMHQRYVAPQIRWADIVLRKPCKLSDLRAIVAQLRLIRHQSC
jgi:uridine kinase